MTAMITVLNKVIAVSAQTLSVVTSGLVLAIDAGVEMDCPASSSVHASMLAVAQYLKIGRIIIERVAIFMVDVLIRMQRTTECACGNNAMLKFPHIRIGHLNHPIGGTPTTPKSTESPTSDWPIAAMGSSRESFLPALLGTKAASTVQSIEFSGLKFSVTKLTISNQV